MLQCSIPPLYCCDYDTNSVKCLHCVMKPTQRKEDERASSPTGLVFFNKMFSFILFFVRKCSQTKLFTANLFVLTKLSLRKVSWLQHPACRQKPCTANSVAVGQGTSRLVQENKWDL